MLKVKAIPMKKPGSVSIRKQHLLAPGGVFATSPRLRRHKRFFAILGIATLYLSKIPGSFRAVTKTLPEYLIGKPKSTISERTLIILKKIKFCNINMLKVRGIVKNKFSGVPTY